MKKLFLTLSLLLAVVFSVNAQEKSDIRLGFVGGLYFGNPLGITAGVVAQKDFSSVLKGLYGESSLTIEKNGDFFYAQLPVYAGYRYELNDNVALLGITGPAINAYLFSTMKDAPSIDFKDRISVDWNFRGGVEIMKNIQITGGYSLGLYNAGNTSGNVTVAYLF